MNIKKIISKVLAVALVAATTASVAGTGIAAKAAEQKEGWKTLVLICPKVEMQISPNNVVGATYMYQSEVDKIKVDAKAMEDTINCDSMNRANMTVDVAVSDMPITSKTNSMYYGSYITAANVSDILDKYAPQDKYDEIMLVYRDKDFSTTLGTANYAEYPMNGNDHSNGAIFTTVKLDDADHSMNFMDKIEPMYLIDRFAEATSSYLIYNGFDLDLASAPVYDGVSDSYQFVKYKRNYYRWYFAGMKWDADGKGGITEAMWNFRPTNK